LDKLEDRGLLSSHLVQGETYPPRKDFQLTEAGKASLQTWLKTPVRRARDVRQEFLAKLIVAHRYGISQVLELIHVQEQACQSWIDELQTNAPLLNKENMDEWFVYSFRLNREQGALQWLKMCELEIEHLLEQV
jgi:DNA-binding PadR family transcriptional regulator